MTTGLYLLRCTQLGLTMVDLECLTLGMVYDMMVERGNDACEDEYTRNATQADFDNF